MTMRGRNHSEEAKEKIRQARIGSSYSEESKKKNSDSHLGKKLSAETKLKIGLALKGRKHNHIMTEETKRKISLSNKGKKPSIEAREKMSLAKKGKVRSVEHQNKLNISRRKYYLETELDIRILIRKAGFKGKHHSDEAKRRLSLSHTKYNAHKTSASTKMKQHLANVGRNSPLWLGGKSFEPYTRVWKYGIKRIIIDRDRHTCQLCHKVILPLKWNHCVHHIDYVKNNCDENNLILLCSRCHGKTNHGLRYFWTELFKEIIIRKFALTP